MGSAFGQRSFLNHGFGDVSLGSAGQESATADIFTLKPDAILTAI